MGVPPICSGPENKATRYSAKISRAHRRKFVKPQDVVTPKQAALHYVVDTPTRV